MLKKALRALKKGFIVGSVILSAGYLVSLATGIPLITATVVSGALCIGGFYLLRAALKIAVKAVVTAFFNGFANFASKY